MFVSRKQLLVLLLVTFGAGAGFAKVGKQWDHDSEQYGWLCEIAVRLGNLRDRRGYPEAPEVKPPLETAPVAAGLARQGGGVLGLLREAS